MNIHNTQREAITASDMSSPDIAATLIAHGYRPVPCRGKRPVGKAWNSREFAAPDFARVNNVGIKTGQGIALVDIDVVDLDAATAIAAEWQRRHPGGLRRTGLPPKTAFLVASDLESKIDLKLFGLPKDQKGHDQKIEVLANGQQFIAYGIHPDTQKPYFWHDLDPLNDFLGVKDALPTVTSAELKDFVEWVGTQYGEQKESLSQQAQEAAGINPRKIDTGQGGKFWRAVNDAALQALDLWVPVLLPAAKRNAHGVWRVSSRDLGRAFQEDLSIHPGGIKDFGPEASRTAIDLVMEHLGGDLKSAAFWLCEKMRVDPTSLGWQEGKPKGSTGTGKTKEKAPTGITPDQDMSEDGVALAFTKQYGDKMRFDHDQGRWFEWSGDRWKPDNTHLAYSYCRRIARELSHKLRDDLRPPFRKAAFAAGVERMARADRAHAVTSEGWDKDTFMLGCPGVTIDLRTGAHLPPSPAHGITKQAAVRPVAGDCPLWKSFLLEVCEGDRDMVRFLKQWAGYCLTGDTREHALLFVYGSGGNGKSVFLETVTHIMGEYAATASMDTFTASKHSQHLTFMAMLRGARLVTASETEEGKAWAETKIKQVTGGDKITANFMRQDAFTFMPQFKLTVVGNHKPVLRNVDDAARRRFNIVPFTVKPKNPDRALTEKLRAEAPAILQWMIEGCLDWQAKGLMRPTRVLDATAEYFDDQDLFGQWLDEACRIEPTNRALTETPKALFENWKDYAIAAGENPGTQAALLSILAKRGLTRDKRKIEGKQERIWRGIELHRKESYQP